MYFEVVRCPNEEIALSNRLAVADAKLHGRHVEFQTPNGMCVEYTLTHAPQLFQNQLGVSSAQRKFMSLPFGTKLFLCLLPEYMQPITTVQAEISSAKKLPWDACIDTDALQATFRSRMAGAVLFVGEQLLLEHNDLRLDVCIKSIECNGSVKAAECTPQTAVIFSSCSGLDLKGEARDKTCDTRAAAIFKPDWNFAEMGIGGLEEELDNVSPRLFFSFDAPFNNQVNGY